MPSGIDIWGVVAGVLGTVALFPLLYSFVNSLLPCTMILAVDEILTNTEAFFVKVNKAGLLKNVVYVVETRNTLISMRYDVETMRLESHRAPTFWMQFKAFMSGVSLQMSRFCSEIKILRADIAATSVGERKRLLDERGRQAKGTAHGKLRIARVATPAMLDSSTSDYPYDSPRSLDSRRSDTEETLCDDRSSVSPTPSQVVFQPTEQEAAMPSAKYLPGGAPARPHSVTPKKGSFSRTRSRRKIRLSSGHEMLQASDRDITPWGQEQSVRMRTKWSEDIQRRGTPASIIVPTQLLKTGDICVKTVEVGEHDDGGEWEDAEDAVSLDAPLASVACQ